MPLYNLRRLVRRARTNAQTVMRTDDIKAAALTGLKSLPHPVIERFRRLDLQHTLAVRGIAYDDTGLVRQGKAGDIRLFHRNPDATPALAAFSRLRSTAFSSISHPMPEKPRCGGRSRSPRGAPAARRFWENAPAFGRKAPLEPRRDLHGFSWPPRSARYPSRTSDPKPAVFAYAGQIAIPAASVSLIGAARDLGGILFMQSRSGRIDADADHILHNRKLDLPGRSGFFKPLDAIFLFQTVHNGFLIID